METKECYGCKQLKPITLEHFENKKGIPTNRCKSCASEYRKSYRKRNRDELSSKQKQYYEKNKDAVKEKVKQYREENKETIKESSRKHYLKNIDQARQVRKRYREENKEKLREFFKNSYQQNKEKKKLQVKLYYKTDSGRETSKRTRQKRKAIEKGLEASLTRSQWKECMEHFKNECAYCGEKKKLEQDHFQSSNKYGEYSKNNIVPACRNCNASKSAKDFFVWYPLQGYYSNNRKQKILRYLNYDSKNQIQQLALL